VFGEKSFISNSTIITNRGGRDYGGIAQTHEYLLIYGKNCNTELNMIEDTEKEYDYYDENGGFNLMELRNRNVLFNDENRPNLCYPFFINPNNKDGNGLLEISLETKEGFIEVMPLKSQGIQTVWRWGKEKSLKNLNKEIKGKIKQDGGFMIVQKSRINSKRQRSLWDEKEFVNERGSESLKELFGGFSFSYPKSPYLLRRILQLTTSPDINEIILDFFSGSATTAHAVMQLNAEDGGNRKFIMVQLPEATDEKSEAYKAGYKNICEIGKERIRRAGKKIAEEKTKANGVFTNDNKLDTGFRVYRLDTTNMQDVYYRPQDYKQENMELFADNIKPDRTADDLLAQVMLDWGLPLSLRMERLQIAGKEVFRVAENSLYACFDTNIDEAFASAVAKDKPLRILFRDSGFKDDTAKTNVKQLLKQLSPETEMKVI
jgi:adenine-specific DNA-methyltransferase